ncbi:glycosyltransferase family 2 protein [Candidatus Gottesmanbacteria bacterium]|nr:glycosyltransferase family 2 protein [Candidatus Gottesmanbacteria bacterium]
MNTISVALATFNEEKNIIKCLESVKDWVDEIVIVDGSSTDKTVEIAKKFKAKILVTDNPPIFHINKQKAIDLCRNDWILQLDADEVIKEELKKEILRVIINKQINGYWIPRKNYFLGRWLSKGGQYPDYTLRLYKKGKGRLPCKSVHEQAHVEGETKYLKSPLLHYPYPDFSHYLDHFKRYTDIFSSELKQEKVEINFINSIQYIFIKPSLWFLKTYIRHKGIVDGFPGLIFCFFSAIRFPVAYLKYWKGK